MMLFSLSSQVDTAAVEACAPSRKLYRESCTEASGQVNEDLKQKAKDTANVRSKLENELEVITDYARKHTHDAKQHVLTSIDIRYCA